MTPLIHTYTSSADRFFVNSFLIETANGVIVVDTQFLTSAAKELGAKLDAIGKPLAAVIITHPHPDHFNGLPILLLGREPVPVYANVATIDGIKATQAEKRAAWTPVFGDDYPMVDALPDHAIGPDETLRIDGTDLRLIDIGPGECMSNTVIHVPDANALIASDLVYNQAHPWLAEHRTSAWLRQLDEVEARFGDVTAVHAGHGPSGTVSLFNEQRRYIQEFRRLVGLHSKNADIPPEGLAAILAETSHGREGWPLAMLIEMNARAAAAETNAG